MYVFLSEKGYSVRRLDRYTKEAYKVQYDAYTQRGES